MIQFIKRVGAFLIVACVIGALLSWFFGARILKWGIEHQLARALGVEAHISGFEAGSAMTCRLIEIRLPGEREPSVIISGLQIAPGWSSLASPSGVVIDEIQADSIVLRYGAAEEMWLKSRSSGKPSAQSSATWKIRSIHIRDGNIQLAQGGMIPSTLIRGNLDGEGLSRHGMEKGLVQLVVHSGIGNLEARLELADTLCRMETKFEGAYHGWTLKNGEGKLRLSAPPGWVVQPGSEVACEIIDPAGHRTETGPRTRIAFSGNMDSGYAISANGLTGNWRGLLRPAEETLDLEGVFLPPAIVPFDKLKAEGRMMISRWNSRLKIDGKALISGELSMTNLRTKFSTRLSAVGDARNLLIGLENYHAEGQHKGQPVSMRIARAEAALKDGAIRIRLLEPAEASIAGRDFALRGEFELDTNGRGRFLDASIAGIPIDASVSFVEGRLQRASVRLPRTSLQQIRFLMPADLGVIWDRSSIEASMEGFLDYGPENRAVGRLTIAVAHMTDPVSGFVVHGFEASIPIQQRFVDPSLVVLDDSSRWPDVPVNLKIGRIGRFNVLAEGVEGRVLFSDYVFRARDVNFSLLGSQAHARFIFDPFRNREGRWRSALEVQVRKLALRRLYEEFVGTGHASKNLHGDLDLSFETAWSDTECEESAGKIVSRGPGVVGAEVIRSLMQLAPKEKRIPSIALLFLGDYNYEQLSVDMKRDVDIHDFRTNILLRSPRHRLLREFQLDDVPLGKLLDGLPVEVTSDIRAVGKKR